MDRREYPPIRRQFNEGFCNPDGSWSPTKTMTVFTQVVLLWKLGYDFEFIAKDWVIMGITLTALISPELLKKFFVMKFGGSGK